MTACIFPRKTSVSRPSIPFGGLSFCSCIFVTFCLVPRVGPWWKDKHGQGRYWLLQYKGPSGSFMWIRWHSMGPENSASEIQLAWLMPDCNSKDAKDSFSSPCRYPLLMIRNGKCARISKPQWQFSENNLWKQPLVSYACYILMLNFMVDNILQKPWYKG